MFLFIGSCDAAAKVGFDFPVGIPDGSGFKNGNIPGGSDGWGYLEWNGSNFHPGEDWNKGSGSADYGEPVFSISNGTIVTAQNYGGNWGNIVLIRHTESGGMDVWSQYSHLSAMNVKRGDKVTKGQIVGKIGDAGGRWASHLHFETRRKDVGADFWPKSSWTRENVGEFYFSPSEFIQANRPLPPAVAQKLGATVEGGKVASAWDECSDKAFERYELYRAEEKGAASLEGKRTTIFSATDAKKVSFIDENIYAGQDYYYALQTFYKDGRTATSEEVTIRTEREAINISNSPGVQRYVGISGNKVYWENNYRDQTTFPERKNLYYYDIETKTQNALPIGNSIERIEGPYKPQINGDWLCYVGKRSRYGNYDIYCRDLTEIIPVDQQITTYGGDEADPAISEEGIVVWRGNDDEGRGRIRWTDLTTGDSMSRQINELTEMPGVQSQPRIWGKNIIWKNQTAIGAPADLRIKNIETGAEALLAAGIGDGTIDIWEDYAIYRKDNQLMVLDLNDAAKAPVAIGDGSNARIRDGKVAYSLPRADGKYNVEIYFIDTGKKITVAESLKYQPAPVVYENLVAYDASIDDKVSGMEIFITKL